MKEYKTISKIAGPLVFVEKTDPIGYGDLVKFRLPDGSTKNGQVLDTSDDIVVIQVFEGTSGIDRGTGVKFLGDTIKLSVSKEMLGRILNGAGKPIDDGPEIIPEKRLDIIGAAINPYARDTPADFIQTGISTIDGTNTLVRGQKLPIFSGSGLPHNEIALQIARQAKVVGQKEAFVVVFAAMGITNEEAQYFMQDFERTGALERSVVFLNLANDPAVERLITPKMALTAAEYLAFEHNMHVLVILTDMTNYCESLREIGAAREEIPGRRGYPGYMYTDLSTIYERAGMIKGQKGSVTQIPILTMIGDDITHPIPDLTGYITEGQIVLSRELHMKNIYPPVDVLPSLSRLMNLGIGKQRTREDHKQVSDQMYAFYAEGRDLRGLVAIVGEEALSDRDKRLLAFAKEFEERFVRQAKSEDRTIQETLDLGWNMMSKMPAAEITRISPELKAKFLGLAEEAKKAEEKKAPVKTEKAAEKTSASNNGSKQGAKNGAASKTAPKKTPPASRTPVKKPAAKPAPKTAQKKKR
jgi:V/A-type H+/Na+-transporting ATPase subunit B